MSQAVDCFSTFWEGEKTVFFVKSVVACLHLLWAGGVGRVG